MTILSLKDLLSHSIREIYSMEKKIETSLDELTLEAYNKDLQKCLSFHREETLEQIKRLEQIAQMIDIELGYHNTHGIDGILKEGDHLTLNTNSNLMDMALAMSVQKVERYEITLYVLAINNSEKLGYSEVAGLLKLSLNEEKETSKKITELIETLVVEEMKV